MSQSQNRILVIYGIALFTGFIVALVVWDIHQDQLRAYDERDLIQDLKLTTAAPEPEPGIAEFPVSLEDDQMALQLQRVARELRPVLDACLKGWPEHPEQARVRLATDVAGRLQSLAVEAAPDATETCFLKVLARGQFPRSADAVAALPLGFKAVHIGEIEPNEDDYMPGEF
jgi:hypothetical protein